MARSTPRCALARGNDPTPMRLRVLSDLHLEIAPWTPPDAAADVVVLAGDVHNGTAGIEWAQRTFDRPVLYVPGNHEYYDGDLAATRARMRAAAHGSHVMLLDPGEVLIGGVRFLGCTLWTDFALNGAGAVAAAASVAVRSSPDFRAIRDGDAPFAPARWLQLHREELGWLADRLEAGDRGSTVVVTHFLPSRASIAPRFAGHPHNAGFASGLEPLLQRARLWVHGHSHARHEHVEHGCRVVCNPRGYPHEATGFVPDGVVVI
jgi:predicted phosphodiesterase